MKDNDIADGKIVQREVSDTVLGNTVVTDTAVAGTAVAGTAVADTDARYPTQLQHDDSPRTLYCRGNLGVLMGPLVAIVGSRDTSTEAIMFTERLAAAVGRMGIAVVSGGARGIDAAAHRGCRIAASPTVVILGVALDAQSSRSTQEVLAGLDLRRDLILTEQRTGTIPRPHHFLLRNRIIARLSHAVCVVRARAMSGALSTAGYALAAGRPLFSVPGAPWDERSVGVNALLSQGAKPVRTPLDLVSGLRAQFSLPASLDAPTPFADARLEFLKQPRTVDELSERWRLSPEQTLRALVHYELAGSVTRLFDGRFVCSLLWV